ncbi:hypothetical protein GCM10025734_18230 [Kitasatospora paranensis]
MADVGERRRGGAGFEIDLAPTQLGCVRAGFGGQAQLDTGGPAVDGGDQGGATGLDQGVVPAHGEHPFQRRQVEFLLCGKELVGLLHEGVDLGADGECAGGGDHAAAGADQDLVAGGLADASQGAAHRGCGDVEAGRGAGDAALFQQRVQGREQVQIQLHGSHSTSD